MTCHAAQRHMRLIFDVVAQVRFQDATVKLVVQSNDRLGAFAQHQHDEFTDDRFDIAKAHRQRGPVADHAADMRGNLRDREIGWKWKYQRHMRGQRIGERIVATTEIFDK